MDRKGGFGQSGEGQVYFRCSKERFGVLGDLCALSFGKRAPEFEVFAANKEVENTGTLGTYENSLGIIPISKGYVRHLIYLFVSQNCINLNGRRGEDAENH